MLRTLLRPPILAAFTLLALIGFLALVFSPPTMARMDRPVELWDETGEWAQETLAEMTLEEKVAQLFVIRAYGDFKSEESPDYRRLLRLVEDFEIGGIALFQGEPYAQVALVNHLQQVSDLPLLIGQDMEWGAGMRIEEATTFPHAMGIGATRNPLYARAVGYATAREARALGVQQIYAPVADVNNNPSNPIINVRSFGGNPQLVAEMATAFATGMQNGGVIATAKHFPGHGNTSTDSHTGLPVLPFTLEELQQLELVPFRALVNSGVMSVMVGHLALPQLEPDGEIRPATVSPSIVRDILREQMGFRGLVVTDALDMRAVTEQYSHGELAVQALEAGVDLLLISLDPFAAHAAIMQAVEEGRLTEERIDTSVMRILRAKEWAGLHQDRLVSLAALRSRVYNLHHRALGRTVARASITLLRNEGDALPLYPDDRDVLSIVLSDSEDPEVGDAFRRSLRAQAHGNLTTRRIDPDSRPSDYSEVVGEARQADVVLVPAFLRVRSWSGQISLPADYANFVDDLIGTGAPVVLIAFGNPYMVSAINPPAAYLAAYGTSEVEQTAAAQALFGASDVSGRLPINIPGRFSFGDGLELEQSALRRGLAPSVGMRAAPLHRIDSLMRASIEQRMFPSATVAVGRAGVLVKQDAYGYHTYDLETPVTPGSVYDLASLTKVIATTTAAMILYEDGRLDLDARVVEYLPGFGQNDKGEVTIRHLLTHSSGLPAYHAYHRMGLLTREAILDSIMAEHLTFEPGTQYTYSDLGMITLWQVIEEITGQYFAEYTEQHIFEPLGMDNTGFRPIDGSDSFVVPTEIDDTFRNKLVQGEVHDETAYILGGTSGHAGLFSTVEDLSTFAYMLLNEGYIYDVQFLDLETIELFTTQAGGVEGSTRALGWDTRSQEGYSSAGDLFGPNSFGHTGFTGTSIWMDPDAELFAILLTNAVYPTREEASVTGVRPKFADLAHRAIAGPPRLLLPDGMEVIE